MKAVIMAGGKGTRIASINSNIPKPMLPVAGKPVLQHQIEGLQRQGFHDIILSIGYMGEQIEQFFGDGSRFGINIVYIKEEAPLGTAGALYYMRELLDDDFLLLNGDIIFSMDFKRMVEFHKEHNALVTLAAHPNSHPYDSGVIVTDDNDSVVKWYTKEEERGWYRNLVNSGIHVISPEMLGMITAPVKTDLDRQILKPIIPSKRLYAYRTPEYIKDMGTPDRIAAVEQDIKSGFVERKNLGNKQCAVFLDRDGTINEYKGFLRNIDDFVLVEGAAEAVRSLNELGIMVIVVTNQPVIARGEVTWRELHEIHNKMETLLGEKGAYIDDIFVCPHHPDKGFEGEIPEYKINCDCRKPKPGLLFKAAEKYNIDLSSSFMIGDSDNDIIAGENAGCTSVKLSEKYKLPDAVNDIKATFHF